MTAPAAVALALSEGVFVLRVASDKSSFWAGSDNELQVEDPRNDGDKGRSPIRVLLAGNVGFPLAEIENC